MALELNNLKLINMAEEDEELEDHIRSLRYFWEEKEDIERYCDYEKILPQLRKKRPDIIKLGKITKLVG